MTTGHGSASSVGIAAQLWDGAGALDPEAQRINFSWLVRLRWGAFAGQAAAIACVHFAMDIPLPLAWLGAILVTAVLYNVVCAAWVKRTALVREPMVALSMGGDVVLLTALLYFTGGPFNPFSFLYLVHIALAAVVLRSWWTWSLVALSLACFGALFIDPAGGAAGHADHSGHMDHSAHVDHSAHAGHMHDHAAHAATGAPAAHGSIMDMHLQGMWVAFGIAAAFIVYFVSRVTRDLAAREAELVRVRSAASRNEKLAALATLAAGAAHELATPLSTIAVAAKDLERSLEPATTSAPSALVEDIRLIRSEVDRCREILRQMSVEAGQSNGEGVVPTRPEQLVQLALEGLGQRARVDVTIEEAARERSLHLPAQALALALRGVLKNALEAAGPSGRVGLRVVGDDRAGAGCTIVVRDDGAGMPASVLARVGEPFFTTKEPGQGMGLGVFVARALCEQIGGKLEIESVQGRGTTVRMSVNAKMEPA